MDRRKALKQVATAVGTIAVTPSVYSFLSSSTAFQKTWTPEFIPHTSQKIMDVLVDFILPNAEGPNGLKLNLAQFVDKMMLHTEDVLSQEKFVLGFDVFKGMLEQTFNKNSAEATENEIKTVMKVLCSLSKEKEIYEHLDLPLSEFSKENKDMYLVYYFVTKLRYYCLLGFYTSKEIVEGIEGVDSYTGYYQGCVS